MNEKLFGKPANLANETVIHCENVVRAFITDQECCRMKCEEDNFFDWFNEDEERTYYDPYTGQEISEREYWDNGCSDEMMDNLF